MSQQRTKYGLKQAHLDEIVEVASSYKEIEELLIYGSRATSKHWVGSDVDLAIKGSGVTIKTAIDLKWNLDEETWLPYLFDVTSYNTTGSPSLRQDIDRDGQLIYCRQK